MPRRLLRFLLPAVLLAGPLALPAHAGMPSFTLTDVAQARIEVISFFVAGYFVLAILLKLLWNALAKDWSWMPRITYPRALGVMLVAGLFCYVILTMISGARELMTPGAWSKVGLTYRLREPTADDTTRRAGLEKLSVALREYAAAHDGKYPPSIDDAAVPADLWNIPERGLMRYTYVRGLAATTAPPQVLAHEPAATAPLCWQLLTDGSIRPVY